MVSEVVAPALPADERELLDLWHRLDAAGRAALLATGKAMVKG
ncbi:MAG: hypothetical protein NTW87_07875 [Planctomycetota bacterium]|nr:hypothetical protein [Planctomycetota bacterium]